jgi:hypothetical protein
MFLRFYHLLRLSPDPKALGTLLLYLKHREAHALDARPALRWQALRQAPQALSYLQTQMLPALGLPAAWQEALRQLEWPAEEHLQQILTALDRRPAPTGDYALWAQRLWAPSGALAPELAQFAVDILPLQPLIEIGGQGQLLATAWQRQAIPEPGWELWAHSARDAALAQLYLHLLGLRHCRIRVVPPAWPTDAPEPESRCLYLTPCSPPESDSLPEAIMAVPAQALLDPEATWCLWRACLPHVEGIWFFPQSDTALLSVRPGVRSPSPWLYLDPGTLPLQWACADARQHLQGGPHRHGIITKF